jgi:hypothetical protein
MMEKSSLVGEGGGCTPHPLSAYYHHVKKLQCTSLLLRNTPSISSLPYMYSVDPPSSPKPHVPHVFEVLVCILNEFCTASLRQEREDDILYWGRLLEATTAKLTAHQLSKEAVLMER